MIYIHKYIGLLFSSATSTDDEYDNDDDCDDDDDDRDDDDDDSDNDDDDDDDDDDCGDDIDRLSVAVTLLKLHWTGYIIGYTTLVTAMVTTILVPYLQVNDEQWIFYWPPGQQSSGIYGRTSRFFDSNICIIIWSVHNTLPFMSFVSKRWHDSITVCFDVFTRNISHTLVSLL